MDNASEIYLPDCFKLTVNWKVMTTSKLFDMKSSSTFTASSYFPSQVVQVSFLVLELR